MLPDIANGRVEIFVDTEGLLGWRFHPICCQVVTLCAIGQFVRISQSGTSWDVSRSSERDGGRVTSLLTVYLHLALGLEIALVSDGHHREVVLALNPKDLLMLAGFLE